MTSIKVLTDSIFTIECLPLKYPLEQVFILKLKNVPKLHVAVESTAQIERQKPEGFLPVFLRWSLREAAPLSYFPVWSSATPSSLVFISSNPSFIVLILFHFAYVTPENHAYSF